MTNVLVEAAAAEGKDALLLNLDETSVAFTLTQPRGHIAWEKTALDRVRPTVKVTKAQKRTAMTHACIIAADPEVQSCLPQYLVGNENIIKAGEIDALRESLPANVFLFRRKTGWMKEPMMLKLLDELAASLAPWTASRRPILLLDAASVHMTEAVQDRAQALGIWLSVIAGGLTWLLQPADVRTFRLYKDKLRRELLKARAASGDGKPTISQWVKATGVVIDTYVKTTNWAPAFRECGVAGSQTDVSPFIRRTVGEDTLSKITPGVPSTADLKMLWSCTALMNAELLAVQHLPPPPALPPPPPAEGLPVPKRRLSRRTSAAELLADVSESGGETLE